MIHTNQIFFFNGKCKIIHAHISNSVSFFFSSRLFQGGYFRLSGFELPTLVYPCQCQSRFGNMPYSAVWSVAAMLSYLHFQICSWFTPFPKSARCSVWSTAPFFQLVHGKVRNFLALVLVHIKDTYHFERREWWSHALCTVYQSQSAPTGARRSNWWTLLHPAAARPDPAFTV